jgi:hypothetical protein
MEKWCYSIKRQRLCDAKQSTDDSGLYPNPITYGICNPKPNTHSRAHYRC